MADKVHGLDINGDQWELQDLPLTEQVVLLQNEVNNLRLNVDYSETEQNTGAKWIDGKDIYKKTINIQNRALQANSSNAYAHGIQNIDLIIKIEAFVKDNTSSVTKILPRLSGGSAAYYLGADADPTNVYVETSSYNYAGYNTQVFTLYYTKTT